MQEQAPPRQKREEPKDVLTNGEVQATGTPGHAQMKPTQSTDRAAPTGQHVKKRASGGLIVVEVLAGTFLAFIVQLLQLRRKT